MYIVFISRISIKIILRMRHFIAAITRSSFLILLLFAGSYQAKSQLKSPFKPLPIDRTYPLWPRRSIPAADTSHSAAHLIDSIYTEIKNNGTYSGNIHNLVPMMQLYRPSANQSNGKAIVIYPGGGYGFVYLPDGYGTAAFLLAKGFTVFIVRYRCTPKAPHPVPFWDAQRALRLVRSLSNKLGYDKKDIGVWGYSAGGHLAGSICVYYSESFGKKQIDKIDRIDARPAYSVLVCPVISMRDSLTHLGSRMSLLGNNPDPVLIDKLSLDEHVTSNSPPAFLAHSIKDGTVNYNNSKRYYEALKSKGVNTVYYLLNSGGHGPLGERDGAPILPKSEEDYANRFITWFYQGRHISAPINK
jgi:acetyl esterase/lipase